LILIVKSIECGHLKAVLPSYLFKAYKISLAEKLELTQEYLTTNKSYRQIAEQYGISKSYAYKIVQMFKDYNIHDLINLSGRLFPDFDLLGNLSKRPPPKPYILPGTPDKLLNALQCVEAIQVLMPMIKAQIKGYEYFTQNMLIHVVMQKNKLVLFPTKSERIVL
jgi:hypothetical protein